MAPILHNSSISGFSQIFVCGIKWEVGAYPEPRTPSRRCPRNGNHVHNQLDATVLSMGRRREYGKSSDLPTCEPGNQPGMQYEFVSRRAIQMDLPAIHRLPTIDFRLLKLDHRSFFLRLSIDFFPMARCGMFHTPCFLPHFATAHVSRFWRI